MKNWHNYIFQKLVLTPEEFDFLITTKRCAKQSTLCWSTSNLKNKSLEYKKSEKLTFEVSILVKKLNNFFFQKMHAHAIGDDFLFWLVPKKMCEGYFFKFVRIRFGKLVSELRKSEQ